MRERRRITINDRTVETPQPREQSCIHLGLYVGQIVRVPALAGERATAAHEHALDLAVQQTRSIFPSEEGIRVEIV